MISRSVVVRLTGGVGNQLFQYCCGRALALRHGCDLYLDASAYRTHAEKSLGRSFGLQSFQICAAKNSRSIDLLLKPYTLRYVNRLNLAVPWRRVKEKQYYFDSTLFRFPLPIYLDGYWQSYKYFWDVEPTIRKDLTFAVIQPSDVDTAAPFAGDDSVMVHIRRGDYAFNPRTAQIHGTLPLEYYYRALEMLSSSISRRLKLFIFSDDYEWVRHNFKPAAYDFHLACDLTPDSSQDLYYMSQCKHHIIANSTYSWWAAWLSQRHGITIAPRGWFNRNTPTTIDLIPPDWRQL